MISSFETIARHFAGQLKVRLIFKEKVCPQTDGDSKIILPTAMGDNLLLPTIAVTIHECYHIKETGKLELIYQKFFSKNENWFKGSPYRMKKNYSFIFNLLEDIRIDTMVLKKYDNAKYIYSTLIEYGSELHTKEKVEIVEKGMDDSVGLKFQEIVQQLYIYALDFDEKHYFNRDLIKDFIATYKKELDEILDNVRIRAEAKDLYSDVEKLWAIIKEYLKIKEQKKEGGGKPSEEELIKILKGQFKKVKQGKIKEINEDIKDINETIKDFEEDIKETQEEEEEDEEGNISEEGEKFIKKTTQKINKKNELKKELEDEIEKAKESINRMEQYDGDIDQTLEKIIGKEADGELLNGFNAVNKIADDLKTNPIPLMDFEASLRDIFKRTEKKKKDTAHITPHLNIKNLHKVYKHEGEVVDLFSETKKVETFSNKLIFLIDSSSSMGSCYPTHNIESPYKISKKNTLVFDCLENVRKVIEENQDTYNIDYSVATFANPNQFGVVKRFDEVIKDESTFLKKYVEKYFHGGTAILPGLERCYEMFEDHCNYNDKRFIICFTDGQFNPGDIDVILKEYNARPEKVVFIGINARENLENRGSSCRAFLEKILMGRVANTVKEMESTLIESLDRIL
jgi:hypothetical protein